MNFDQYEKYSSQIIVALYLFVRENIIFCAARKCKLNNEIYC